MPSLDEIMTIKTNNIPRPLLQSHEIDEEKTSYFDEEFLYVKYKGWYYSLDDFIRSPLKLYDKWDGYLTETAFSGLLIELKDEDNVVIGTYIN